MKLTKNKKLALEKIEKGKAYAIEDAKKLAEKREEEKETKEINKKIRAKTKKLLEEK